MIPPTPYQLPQGNPGLPSAAAGMVMPQPGMPGGAPIQAPPQPQQATHWDGRQGTVDSETGGLWVPTPDGGMELSHDWLPADERYDSEGGEDHYENLAERIDASELSRIADLLWRGISADDRSRRNYLESIADAIKMLGVRVEEPGPTATAEGGAPLEGMSTIKNPLLLEAVVRFQSEAMGELLPTDGPVKVRDDSDGQSFSDLAQALETDMNHFVTSVMTEYYPSTDRGLFHVGLTGCIFKKVINCPVRRRPASDVVLAEDLIVNAEATDFDTAARVTHQIDMQGWELKQAIADGRYRDIDILQATVTRSAVDEAAADATGIDRLSTIDEDRPYVLWECYTRLNIKGFEDKDGIALPYQVTMDRESRQILEIRRNWTPDDERRLPRKIFVKWPYLDALGFYSIGLMHLLGNTNRGLTAAWRLMFDAGMFSNFPGFLFGEMAGKQLTNVFRVPPGGGAPIQTGGRPISEVVMPLPYKGVDQTLLALTQAVELTGQRIGNTAEIKVGEGKQDAPVGTTLALIEQATKVIGAVFKRLHMAQAEELALIKERLREDPEAFWRYTRKPCIEWNRQKLMLALENCALVPASDPNTPSKMHRIMRAQAVFMMALQAPTVFQPLAVAEWIMDALNAPKSLLATPQQFQQAQQAQAQAGGAGKGGQPDPTKPMELQMKMQQAQAEMQARQQEQQQEQQEAQQEAQIRAHEMLVESQDRAADRQSREKVASIREETERMRLQAEMQRHGAEMQHEQQQAAADQAMQHRQMAADQQQQQQEMAADAQDRQHQMAMDQQRHEADMQQQAQQADFAQQQHRDEMQARKRELSVKTAGQKAAKPAKGKSK